MSEEAPGCLGAIFRLFGLGGNVTNERGAPPVDVYRVRDDFLSPAEASFFRVLRTAAGDRYHICPKVRLADVFFVSRPQENQSARNRIAQRHVDFLLCDPTTLKPVAGLELDDASHRRAQSVAGDQFKDEVFAAARLPLVRVPARSAYEPAQVMALIAGALHQQGPEPNKAQENSSAWLGGEQEVVVDAGEKSPTVLSCPKCAAAMVLRTAQRGANRGGQFWGCVNYPRCRQVIGLGETPLE